jgi:hypothetical protein
VAGLFCGGEKIEKLRVAPLLARGNNIGCLGGSKKIIWRNHIAEKSLLV